jgi:hypothetical protein
MLSALLRAAPFPRPFAVPHAWRASAPARRCPASPSQKKRLVKAIKSFFKSFENQDFSDLSEAHIQKLLDTHRLSVSHLLDDYCKKVKDLK